MLLWYLLVKFELGCLEHFLQVLERAVEVFGVWTGCYLLSMIFGHVSVIFILLALAGWHLQIKIRATVIN